MAEIDEIAGDESLASRYPAGETAETQIETIPIKGSTAKAVNKNGTSTEAAQKADAEKTARTYGPVIQRVADSRLAEIREKIDDPNFSQVDLSKLIAFEMSLILESMNSILDNVTQPGTAAFDKIATKEIVASLGEQLKGVRELGKQINEMDSLAKRDYINFDGDKFFWILQQWIKVGKAALEKMGWESFAVQSWENHFRTLLHGEQERIRREADKQVWLEEKDKAKKQQAIN